MFFLEKHLALPLGGNYRREKRGPFDPVARELVEQKARELSWFKTDPDPASKFIHFRLGSAIAQGADEGRKVLLSHISEADRILRNLATLNTEDTEIAATAYAVWNDFLIDGVDPTEEQIIEEFRKHWHPEKERFSPAVISTMLAFLQSHNLRPKGIGPKTLPQSLDTKH